jgi:hypothetical protein
VKYGLGCLRVALAHRLSSRAATRRVKRVESCTA